MPLENRDEQNEALLPRARSGSGRDHTDHVVCGDGKVGLVASTATLLLGVLGAGQLTLPFAVNQAGLVLAVAYLALLGVLAVVVLKMLMVSSKYTGQTTYAAVLEETCGPKARLVANTLLGIYAWGGAVSFLILVADELEDLSAVFGWDQPRWILITMLSVCVVYPLSLCSNLDRLKFTSYLGATAAIYINFVVFVNAPWFQNGKTFDTCGGYEHARLVDDPPRFDLFPNTALGAFNSLPLIAFALNSAWCFVPILNSLYEPTPPRVNRMITSANVIILTNYALLAFVGYFSYCSNTKDNILGNLPSTPLVIVARVMLIMQLSFALPLRFHVTRGVLYEQAPFMPSRQLSDPSTSGEKVVYTLSTTLLVGVAVMIAALTSNLHVVIGLTSAVCASFTIYIFPALSFRIAVAHKEPHTNGEKFFMNIAPYICIATGVAVLVLGTGAILVEVAFGMKVTGG
ncbi:hypothetical protein SARC_03775 [Sphaeroforma arctica JP610]|uniref:Amino acid transporter transmembrane domain-containing protein n=1 Tax=Sphaeroforma arctica JP610 TaxID=667725 RepID=A0A0L0G4H0_9EUKA|nr:hypothetical protein SARC_03775 [Sphaeroforma arctica JP610]KNC83987.1 hypothetical protein SARC_03775 [Sphaeroforma arctica JP610]|eukprot:XP_014157889.1 hypothetical protein SARC_03775 [Sphaeroforma arctica JP610]